MLLDFDVQELERAINSFYDAMDVSISILYEDYSVLGSKKLKNPYCHLVQTGKIGLTRCMDQNCMLLERCKSTKKAEMHICHAGLVEMAVPIIHSGDVIGYVLLGHIKMKGVESPLTKISDLPVDIDRAQILYDELPPFDREKIIAICDMAEIFIKYVMAQRLIKPRENADFEAVKHYVYENLDKKLTSQSISHETHLSKTSLYNVIKKCTGHTVNEYINSVRITKSKEMLDETEMPIEEIAEKLGFSSVAYFSRLFKEREGISPSVYRKGSF